MRVQTHSGRIPHPSAVCIVMRTYSALPIYHDDLRFPRRMTTILKCFAGLISCNTSQPKLDEPPLDV